MLQQRVAARFADAGNVIQERMRLRLAAPLAMVRDGEAVRLVADALQEVQRGRVARQSQWLAASRQEHQLVLLGQADGRNVFERFFLKHAEANVELAFAAVN